MIAVLLGCASLTHGRSSFTLDIDQHCGGDWSDVGGGSGMGGIHNKLSLLQMMMMMMIMIRDDRLSEM